MARMTRAKLAEAAEKLQLHEDEVLALPPGADGTGGLTVTSERAPLGEISPNGSQHNTTGDEHEEGKSGSAGQETTLPGRGKKTGRKGAAKGGKKGEGVPLGAACEGGDENASPSAASPTRGADATGGLIKGAALEGQSRIPVDVAWEAGGAGLAGHMTLMQGVVTGEDATSTLPPQDTRAISPPSAAVRLTRSQMAKRPEVVAPLENQQESRSLRTEKALDTLDPTTTGEVSISIQHHCAAIEPTTDAMGPLAIDAPASPLPSAVPNVIANLRKETRGKRSTSNKENVEPDTPPALLSNETLDRTPQSNSTYDALEAAVVHAASPPMTSRRSSSAAGHTEQSSPRPADTILALDDLDDAVERVRAQLPDVQSLPEQPKPDESDSPVESKSPAKPESPPKTEKAAPVVRATKASQARISLAQGDKGGWSRPPAIGRPRPSMTLGRAASVRSNAGARIPSGDSSKSGDAPQKVTVIPHSKPRPISMSFPAPPPPPKSTKPATKSTFQLPGEAIAAKLKASREERAKKEADEAGAKAGAFKARPAPPPTKKGPLVRPTNASKFRESLMTGRDPRPASVSQAHKRATSVAAPAQPRVAAPMLARKPSVVGPRPSTAMANIGKPRAALADSAPAAAAPAPAPVKGTAKGKEVFARAGAAKDAAERERRDKEEAAKQARAAAAERGRAASREWAERQRLRKLAEKVAVEVPVVEGV